MESLVERLDARLTPSDRYALTTFPDNNRSAQAERDPATLCPSRRDATQTPVTAYLFVLFLFPFGQQKQQKRWPASVFVQGIVDGFKTLFEALLVSFFFSIVTHSRVFVSFV